jgi:hypothetical protein
MGGVVGCGAWAAQVKTSAASQAQARRTLVIIFMIGLLIVRVQARPDRESIVEVAQG